MSESKLHKPQRIVLQAPRFGRSKKRLPTAAQLEVDEAVKGIAKGPLSGEPKTQQQLLLASLFNSKRNIVGMLDVGPHENFCRELQKYLGAR
jgi:hypothetical protein